MVENMCSSGVRCWWWFVLGACYLASECFVTRPGNIISGTSIEASCFSSPPLLFGLMWPRGCSPGHPERWSMPSLVGHSIDPAPFGLVGWFQS